MIKTVAGQIAVECGEYDADKWFPGYIHVSVHGESINWQRAKFMKMWASREPGAVSLAASTIFP